MKWEKNMTDIPDFYQETGYLLYSEKGKFQFSCAQNHNSTTPFS